jgi:hypothetical protein
LGQALVSLSPLSIAIEDLANSFPTQAVFRAKGRIRETLRDEPSSSRATSCTVTIVGRVTCGSAIVEPADEEASGISNSQDGVWSFGAAAALRFFRLRSR